MPGQEEVLGFTRGYFYRRFAFAARQVVKRGKGQQAVAVVKVNLMKALDNLRVCPVCGSELTMYSDYPMERSCNCGDFTITEVWSTGEIVFEFKMNPQEEEVVNVEAGPNGDSS